jgi:ribosomal protein L16 Arg81 hydroxylase
MKPVEQRSEMKAKEFVEEYLRKNKPVVLKDAAPYWRERWTPKWLKEQFGTREIVVETGEKFVQDKTQKTMTLAELVDIVLSNSLEFRVRSMSFLSQVPELQNEFQAQNQFESYLRGVDSPKRAFWITPNGNSTLLHHDTFFDNLNVQIFGRKQFILMPPSSYKSLYVHLFSESPLDPRQVPHDEFPQFDGVDLSEVVVEPGDVIFIPQFWWHFVTSIGTCINVNSWAKATTGAVKEVTSQMPLTPRYFYRIYHKDATSHLINKNIRAAHRVASFFRMGREARGRAAQ